MLNQTHPTRISMFLQRDDCIEGPKLLPTAAPWPMSGGEDQGLELQSMVAETENLPWGCGKKNPRMQLQNAQPLTSKMVHFHRAIIFAKVQQNSLLPIIAGE